MPKATTPKAATPKATTPVTAKKASAGILLFRGAGSSLAVLLVHPGGPFWAKKDDHAWSIPKGEFTATTEDPFAAAKRELAEETGGEVTGAPVPLQPVKQPSGKWIHAFAVAQDFDPAALRSNTFEIEWPPRSGTRRAFPEVDRAAWFSLDEARRKLVPGQVGLLDQLAALQGGQTTTGGEG